MLVWDIKLKRVRILLAHNSPYYPSFGGGDKSNRLMMAALAARGHQVRVLARIAEFGARSHETLVRVLAARDISSDVTHEAVQFELDGGVVSVFTRGRSLRSWLSARMSEFHPDVILTSTDDPAHLMLGPAMHVPRARVVYLVRAMIALPFGPAASFRSKAKSELLRQTDGSVAVSEYVAAYARQWGNLKTLHLPISLPDRSDPPEMAHFENRFVTMINPCGGKGISIFLGLAQRLPDVEFAAVPSWGTTAADMAALQRYPNITVLAPTDDIDRIFRQTRVALVPSLWAEARSRVVLEAMMRGIPVLASDVGGMAEAMLGMDYLLPVNPIACYHPMLDELMVPMLDIPGQNTDPWIHALHCLADRTRYEDLSLRCRATAIRYARSLSVAPLEAYLQQVMAAPRHRGSPERAKTASCGAVHGLSAEKRRLLALRLKQSREKDSE